MTIQKHPYGYWTNERIIEESKKYTSRTEFAINSPTAYQHACEDKIIFKEMPWIKEKKKPDGYWDVKEHVMEEGKKYKNRTEFSPDFVIVSPKIPRQRV